MRDHVEAFAVEAAHVFTFTDPIVEVGVRPAEGQESRTDLRTVFAGHEYIGCDLQEGPRVDRIEDIHNLSFEDGSVGALLAFDTLEHVANPTRAMEEVFRVLRPGGVALITSVMFFPIHAHPWDYWRFTPEGFDLLLQPFESRLVLAMGWELMPETVFGVGIKGPYPGLGEDTLPETAARCRAWGQDLPVDLGPMRMSVRGLWDLTLKETVSGVKRRVGRVRAGAPHQGTAR
ncbi:MAG TPA: class I SAM-dependent methyltransferase [Acidimicrobiales bacterium]|nr:class I SAM-dependent methyltransferase [Acidimicrobiales bacterium]